MAKDSTAMTAFLDSVHRACFDDATGTVTFTAHGAGDDVIHVDGPMTHARLKSIVRSHDFRCCDWPTLLAYARMEG